MRPQFDDRDNALRLKYATALDAIPGPRVGDWIRFACGIVRRVSYVWRFEDAALADSIQTSCDGYGFHLGDGFVSFSGSLYRGVHERTLTLTNERRDGRVWLWHHGMSGADCGVETTIPFRVYTCSENAPE